MNVFRKPLDSERNPHATLYVGNLDPQATEPLLYELFVQVGPVRLLHLPKDRVLRTHQGFGFVEFRTVADAEYALGVLRGARLFGRVLKMKKSDAQNVPAVAEGVRPKMSVGARLFVNNVSELVDEGYLRQTFGSFGELLEASVVRDKGHAFVEFADFESSDKAIAQMNGAMLMNNKVAVAYAYKEGLEHKKVPHGDDAERLLAQQGKKNLKPKKRRK